MAIGAPVPMLTDADYATLKEAGNKRLREALEKSNAKGETLVVMGPAGPALVAVARNLNAGLLWWERSGLPDSAAYSSEASPISSPHRFGLPG